MEQANLISKAEANYQKDSGGEAPCASCANFIAPDACSAVEGTISENGTCDLYSAKDSEGQLMSMLFGGSNG